MTGLLIFTIALLSFTCKKSILGKGEYPHTRCPICPIRLRVCTSGNFFYRKSTIGTTIAAIGANNDTYCLKKWIEKFSLYTLLDTLNLIYVGVTFKWMQQVKLCLWITKMISEVNEIVFHFYKHIHPCNILQ